jgi:hypothetical protein
MRHRKIFAEVFKGQLERDFFELGADKKPAVLAEVHFEHSVFDTYEEFLSELNAFMSEAAGAKYWVFIGESEPFFFDLYICKLRSVGIALKAANTIPTDYHAGAVGLLLGYPYPKVVEYAKRNAPIEFR